MDELTTLVSSVEYYGYLKNIPSDRVYVAFEKNGLVKMILESSKNFPEMGVDFYAGMVDGMIFLESDAEDKMYTHYEERTELLKDVIARIAKKHHMNAEEACHMYYNSQIAKKVSEDNTRYYQKSADEIYQAVEQE